MPLLQFTRPKLIKIRTKKVKKILIFLNIIENLIISLFIKGAQPFDQAPLPV
jgi:hypothetical protein